MRKTKATPVTVVKVPPRRVVKPRKKAPDVSGNDIPAKPGRIADEARW